MAIKIRYKYFWPGFTPEDSLFSKIIGVASDSEVQIVYDSEVFVDLEIHSVYRKQSLARHALDRLGLATGRVTFQKYTDKYRFAFDSSEEIKSKRSVWYTAENIEPPLGVYDATISFEHSDEFFNNLYFPFWMYRINWNLGNRLTEISPTPLELSSPREVSQRNWSASVFSSTRNPSRLALIKAIEEVLPVSKYGSAFGNRVESKRIASQKHLFQICPENSKTFGYVTEKLQEAWAVGSLPIWTGVHSLNLFNKEAYLDLTSDPYETIPTLLNELTLDEVLYRISQPLLIQEPKIQPLIDFFKNLV